MRIKKFLGVLLISTGLCIAIATPYYVASAENGTAICSAQTDASKNVGVCINRIYVISLAVGGILAVLIFVIAGYRYMQGGAEQKAAITMAESAVVGLVILFGTYIFLNTINPDLTSFTGLSLPNVTCGTGNALCAAPTSNALGSLGNTVTNPGSGIATGTNNGGVIQNFPRIAQSQLPWGSQLYGSCTESNGKPSTIGTSGCGPTELAAVIEYYQGLGKVTVNASTAAKYGSTVDPSVIAKIAVDMGFRVCGSGTSDSMFGAVAPLYGLRAQTADWNDAIGALQAGKPVIAAMGPGLFTSGGHFIVMYALAANDVIMTADSSGRNIQSAPLSTVQNQEHFLTIISAQ